MDNKVARTKNFLKLEMTEAKITNTVKLLRIL